LVSQTVRYALQILGYLVVNTGRRVRGDEIAKATGIPANYLSKILNQLRKHGIVDSRKGWGGGFVLRAEAAQRSIGDILPIFEGSGSRSSPQECLFGLPNCDAENPCPLHPYWERIREPYGEMLRETPISRLTVIRR
jgi:Rrf2 family protein